MSNEKKNDRRISRINPFMLSNAEADSGAGRGIRIEVLCSSDRLSAKLYEAARSVVGKQALRSVLYGLIDEGTTDQSRLYLMQPQVPVSLLQRLEKLRKHRGPRSGRELVKTHLEKVFDLEQGKRKTYKQGDKTKLRRFPNHAEFLKRANELAASKDLGRFTYNAKSEKAKDAILAYIDRHRLTQTAFFSAILERICDAEESQDQSPTVATVADQSTHQPEATTP